MLALGIFTVHVALDTRVGSRIDTRLMESEPDGVELVVIFGANVVVLAMVMGFGNPLDPTPGGCAYPFSPAAVLPTSTGIVDVDSCTGYSLIEAIEERLDRAVTLRYGAEWLN